MITVFLHESQNKRVLKVPLMTELTENNTEILRIFTPINT